MREAFAAVALHRPSRPENIGGVLRAADVYGVGLVVLGGGELPPEPLGHGARVCALARRRGGRARVGHPRRWHYPRTRG